jgi:hypothetical protein
MKPAPERTFNLNTLPDAGEMSDLIQAMDWAKTLKEVSRR